MLDPDRNPLDPIHPGAARRLLNEGQAAVFRARPFTILLKKSIVEPVAEQTTPADPVPTESTPPTPLRLKIDPGSKTTGLAIVNDATGVVVWAGELHHRGQTIRQVLEKRRDCRRSRRHRHTRYRPARFANRTRREGWLPPSLESRVANVLTWVQRLRRLCPIGAISMELVRFDTQLMQDAEISGVEYQSGTLAGMEVREYLLEKWQRKCAYCGAEGVPLQIEHVLAKSRGGSDRVSNLALACEPCNIKKDTQRIEDFLKKKPEVLAKILAQARVPLRDAAAVNTTRWALWRRLDALGLPLETGTGGRTKFNRSLREIPKTHWLDAACVGASTPEWLRWQEVRPLCITATGRHSRQMVRMDKYGFPRGRAKATSVAGGFRTGDLVRAIVPASSKKTGIHVGRIAIRATGMCNIQTGDAVVQGVHYRFCQVIQRGDGYGYS